MELTTPALLFPAISLLLLAYTSRFLALAQLTRSLHSEWQGTHHPTTRLQIALLRRRLGLIRAMQICGVASFALCTASMLLILLQYARSGQLLLGLSLLALLISLVLSLREVSASTQALNLQLDTMESGAEAVSARSDV
ncbi:MAG: DUF2721 domain-containing protein [Polyangiaceae bacterium]|nr:DUF2721 domain-containing protein [Polyangiaceae bacterium]